MQHILLTRFNLKINPDIESKENLGLNNEWLEHRFQIFHELCFPSVLNQSKKDFLWIIFFDIHTPEVFKKKAESLSQYAENIKIIFIDGFRELNSSLQNIIQPFIVGSFVISTRLDNDDIIHKDFLATIGELAIQKNNTVIDLIAGHQLKLINKKAIIKKYENAFNPFVSLVETNGQIKTVLSKMHNEWKNANEIIKLNKKHLWIEYTHDKNIANYNKLFLCLSNDLIFSDYGIKDYDFKYSQLSIRLLNIFISPFNLMYKIYKRLKC